MPDAPIDGEQDSTLAPEPVDLCAAQELQERGRAVVFDVVWRGEPMRAFALRHGEQVRAYLNRCAHMPAELDWNPGEFLDADGRWILCSIHGAAYHPHTGRCAGGPCGRGALVPISIREEQGRVAWYPSADLRPLSLP